MYRTNRGIITPSAVQPAADTASARIGRKVARLAELDHAYCVETRRLGEIITTARQASSISNKLGEG